MDLGVKISHVFGGLREITFLLFCQVGFGASYLPSLVSMRKRFGERIAACFEQECGITFLFLYIVVVA